MSTEWIRIVAAAIVVALAIGFMLWLALVVVGAAIAAVAELGRLARRRLAWWRR